MPVLHTIRRVILLLGCAAGAAGAQAGPAPVPLAQAERAWTRFRNRQDALRMARNQGRATDTMPAAVEHARQRVLEALEHIVPASLRPGDRAAFEVMKQGAAGNPAPSEPAGGCAGAWRSEGTAADSLAGLTAHVMACYGEAAQRIIVGPDTLDRLTIFGLLGRTEDRARRELLFKALAPVWESVNGDGGEASPYRAMVRLRVGQWRAGGTPMAQRARALGIEPDTLTRWLERILAGWRATLPDTLVEPWDWYYHNGEASRLLSPRIPRDSLLAINHRYYRRLGADPAGLGVRYDIDPRPGKYPVAFTDIASRSPMRAWVSTAYRTGGLDNLSELLHETGHAVHVSAIRTRPAFSDWPDSDTFTEAVADLAALELYEPGWQRRFLGTAAPLAASLRAKYSGIMLDIAWALFEIRVHQHPDQGPNRIWADLTSNYLGIVPHPEWSWWAMRGQLVDGPGYMLNYAFGALLVADLRAELTRRRGRFTTGDSGWYAWVAPRLFRDGAGKPALEVVRRFLGRDVRADALLSDLARARPASRSGGFAPPRSAPGSW